jgi:hypothetical protein
MAIPARTGTQVISISMPRPGIMGPQELATKIYVAGPRDFNTLIQLRLEWGNWVGYQLRLVEKRPLQAGEAQEPAMAPAGPQSSQAAPLIVAEQPGSHQEPAVFSFQERLWQKTALLFGLYWLWRWLLPEWMPQALRQLDGRVIIVLCAIPAALLSGIEFLAWKSSAARSNSS